MSSEAGDASRFSTLLRELRRRRVFRAAGLYLVVAWGVLEVSTTVFPLLGLPEWSARLVLGLLAVGFPAAVGLAWMFDVGPRGVRVESDGAASGGRFGSALVVAAATVVGLGLGALVLARWGEATDEGRGSATTATLLPPELEGIGPERTVAVLPFRDLGEDPSNAYFAEGIGEQIVTILAGFDDVRVVGGARVTRWARADEPLDVALSTVGAGYALEGSVGRSGERARITARLTRAGSGAVAWADEYELDLTVEDLFEAQREVAREVARALHSRMNPRRAPVSRPTGSLEAFDRFLRGNHELARRTPASVTRAIAEYRSASELDPGFADALTREAYANALFVDWGWSPPGGAAGRLIERGLALADSVLGRDSTSAEAWLARAYLLVQKDPYRMEGAIPAFERAIRLDPANAEAYHQYGQSLMALGRFGEAAAAYHSALALEPDRAMTLVPLSALASRAGDVDEALRWADSAVAVGPDVPYARAVRSGVRLRTGDPAGAAEDAEAALRIDPSYAVPARSALAAARFALGDTAAARAELERARAALLDPARPGPTDALYMAGTLVALGRHDEALDLLERTRPRSAWLWFYLQSPVFAPLREDPRFRSIEAGADPTGQARRAGGNAPG